MSRTIRLALILFLLLVANTVFALGVNSCSGTNACTGVDTNLIGDNACNGDFACMNLKPQNVIQNACNGSGACWDSNTTNGLTMTVGQGSCIGHNACASQNNPSPVTFIGSNSCVGVSACAGWGMFFRAENNSCHGFLSCSSTTGAIGFDACNGDRACRGRFGGFTVNNRSCNGDDACHMSNNNIGLDTCNGVRACQSHGGRIGNNSCNGTETCDGGFSEIPDCAFNLVRPALCTNPDLRITVTDGATRATQGNSISYTIVASNDAGTTTEVAATVTDAFPPELTNCEFTSVAAGGASGNDPGPSNDLADSGVMLPPASTVTYTAQCDINAAASGTLTGAASIVSSSVDPAPFDNAAQDVDTLAYSASGFASVADSGDGTLVHDESIDVGATQLLVDFSGAMFDPAGDTTSGDVTDPANYVLLSGGANGEIDTPSCASPFGDDAEIVLAGVAYGAGPPRAALRPAGALALPAGAYRVDVCATLDDSTGYPIVPAARAFRVIGSNRLAQPNFDASLAGWDATSPMQWAGADAGPALTSGSAEIQTTNGAGQVFDLRQCLPVTDRYEVARARVRIQSATANDPDVRLLILPYDGADCTGNFVGANQSTPIAGDTALQWLPISFQGPVGAAARSVRVIVRIASANAAEYTVNVDDAYYGDPVSVFANAFE